jgi:hypothetical protein
MKVGYRFAVAATLTVTLVFTAITAERNTLTESYRVRGETLLDPPVSEARNSHFCVELNGAAARDLYNSMETPAKPDDCTDPDSRVNIIDAMQSTRYEDGQRHRCWFGIDIRKQRIVRGVIC